MNKKLLDFVQSNKPLFWDIPADRLDGLSTSSIVERILSYGDMPEINDLVRILTISETHRIFNELKAKPRNNFRPATIALFDRIFARYDV